MKEVVPDWYAEGGVLGIAVDLDAGALLCTKGGEAGWATCFPAGLRPGAAVGGALLPAVSCTGGARVRCNLGIDAARPLRHAAPSGEYRPFGADVDPQVPRSPISCTKGWQPHPLLQTTLLPPAG